SALISPGDSSCGITRQSSSKVRIVSLSIVPAANMPSTALWIASKASLLNLRLVAMVNLQQCTGLDFRFQISFPLEAVEVREFPERQKLVVIDICPILLGEEIGEYPELSGLRQND